MIWTLAVLPMALLLLGTPIFAIFLIGAVATFVLFLSVPPVALHQIMFGAMENYALLAVPFFIFAGELMSGSGIARRLIVWVLALIGRIPGSLGVATVGACTLIGAISGASTATVAVVGKTLYPGLIREGYGARFASGLLSSSGSIDIVIPPSIAMILFGMAAEQSIAKLFAAGVLPGLLIALMMSSYVVIMALRMRLPTRGEFDFARLRAATWDAGPALRRRLVWTLYAILVGRYVYREMSWQDVLDAATQAAIISAQILIIVATAALFSWILTVNGVPQAITGTLTGLDLPPWAFLMTVNIILLIVGCFLDPTSAIIVLTPLFMPLVQAVGIDPIHFGIVMTVNIAIGMFTPPFGLNIFVAQSVLGVPLDTIYRGVLPFAVVQIAALLIITYWPGLSLYLATAL